jgi:hypothetical protein
MLDTNMQLLNYYNLYLDSIIPQATKWLAFNRDTSAYTVRQ